MKNEEIVNEFLRDLKIKGYSEKTIKNYQITLKQFLRIIDKKYENIIIDDVKKYMIYLRDNNCKNSTIYRYLSNLKMFFMFIHNDIIDQIEMPRVEKSLPTVLGEEEIEQLLGSITDLRDLAIIRLLYASGLRVSELVNLNKKDLEGNRITVKSGKGGKDRIVFIDDETVEIIQKYLKKRKDKKHPLFINRSGQRISPRTIQYIVKKCAEQAGIQKRVTPHTLRHSFATHMVANNAHIEVVRDLLGHSSLNTTQVYIHLSGKHKQEIYERSHPFSRRGMDGP